MNALPLLLAAAVPLQAWAAPSASDSYEARAVEHYKVEKMGTPPGVDPQIGAVATLANGRIAVAFHHGEIGILNPKSRDWVLFAEGLHEPLGLLEEADGSLLVMQRPELTRLRDTDGDGAADQFDSLWNGFGMSGNYHEFAFGPARGPNGKLYVALNLASNGAGIRKEIRGEWSEIGLPRAQFYGDWKKAGAKAGRMYSRVPWRGWVLELDPVTGEATPFASGFRSPDGVGFDQEGNLLVSDNQGDWRGTSELHVVQRDGFYGHPASLVWKKEWDGADPLQIPTARLDALRTPAAVWFPQNIYANSPTQPVIIPKTAAWGAFGGQTLIGEMNSPRMLRLLTECVEGVWQGACINLAELKALKGGIHRLAFQGDTLWIGRTHLSWAGGEGLATLAPTGKIPFDPLDIHVTPRGFRIAFTEPLSAGAAEPAAWMIEHYTYAYHATYGSPQMEKGSDIPLKVTLSEDRRSAEVELGNLKENFIYDIRMGNVLSATGQPPLNPHLAYTLRRIPKQ
ncbi:MAG: hypothetical protein V4710_12220 [Verrucomicrobiota bacterium]